MNIERIIKPILEKYLKYLGGVLLSGPKWCGKTYLSNEICKSSINFQDKTIEQIKSLSTKTLLNGDIPRLIDEWQDYPHIWNLVRNQIDIGLNGVNQGLYILTGSSKPVQFEEVRHSGAGRIGELKLATLTFAEILNLDNDHSVSLKKLINNPTYKPIENPYDWKFVNNLLIKGGWPEIYAKNLDSSSILVTTYIDSLINSDYYKNYSFRNNKKQFEAILTSLARLTGSQINYSTVASDINNELDRETIIKYISMLSDLDVIFNLYPWGNKNIRSKNKIRTKPKTYFCDTSLVCRLLDVKSPETLMYDVNTTGIIFENQVIKDLTVYAQALDAELYFYRDEKGNEIDAILEFDTGEWIPIEIKLSSAAAFDASKKLDNVIEKLKMDGKYKEPKLKLIITSCEEFIQLNNGTYIIPHTLLKL